MERLTGYDYIAGVKTGDLLAGVDPIKVYDRLAAYEETGLEPEEVAKLAKATSWISVNDRLPEAETEVFILADHDGHKVCTTAIYEDGKVDSEESNWNWYDSDFCFEEESGIYRVPEGWWEYRHYIPDDTYNGAVDGVVTHWMPLPELPTK